MIAYIWTLYGFKIDKGLLFFRTPWCVAFHPSHDGLLASGCLGGHVRIWDLNGGSELWTAETINYNPTINSLAFHPSERLLVIAISNEIHFWDWSLPEPFCKVATKTDQEKVRYVKFDSTGHHLVTGIANVSNNLSSRVHTYCSTRSQQRAMARARRPPLYPNPNTGESSPAYGRYLRGSLEPLQPVRQRPILSNLHALVSTSTNSSASQTLSDLAAAASDQLMAENAAAAAAAAGFAADAAAAAVAADAAEAAAEAAAVIPRIRRLNEDPLLSDHPYGASTAQRPPPTAPNNSQQDPLLSDHPYGSPTGGRPPPTGYNWLSESWMNRPFRSIPPLEEMYQRERRELQMLSHASRRNDVSGGRMGGLEDFERNSYDRFRKIRERRLARNMSRRQYLFDRILHRRHAASLNTNTSSSSTRPIDDWAINRRLALQNGQARDPYGLRSTNGLEQSNRTASTSTNQQTSSTDDNDDNDSMTAQFGDFIEDTTHPASIPRPLEPEVTARPLSTIDTNSISQSDASVANHNTNDHNYTLSPGATSSTSSATSPSIPDRNNAEPSGSSQQSSTEPSSSRPGNSNNLDITLLNRHIDHMQRICRDSLADCTASRKRRQMVKLHSIKRILEDLQKQIRSLRNASLEELRATRNSVPPSNNDTDDDDLETTAQLGLDERNYDERVGEGYHMRNLARSSLNRAINRLSSETNGGSSRMSTSPHQITTSGQNLHRTSSRLSRVHNQLVSQMRATFRAMEMSPDLSQRGKSPLANAKAEASKEVMEKTKKTATVLIPTSTRSASGSSNVANTINLASGRSSSTRQELRALSQRLEKMLRDRREATSVSNQGTTQQPSEDAGYESSAAGMNIAQFDLNIPRPDPLPIDPRKRWRHMYDGSLPQLISSNVQNSMANLLEGLDSSESGSESDLDLQNLANRGRDVLWSSSSSRLYPRQHSPRSRLRWGPLDQRRLSLGSRYTPGITTRSNSLRRPFMSPVTLETNDPNMVESNDPTPDDLGSERLPPLRELIWRRLRRRNATALARMARIEHDQEAFREALRSSTPGTSSVSGGQVPVRTQREGLSWMVDQMRIDQATNTTNGNPIVVPHLARTLRPSMPSSTATLESPSATSRDPSELPSTSRNIPSISIPSSIGMMWNGMDPYNHASFRNQYVNRIRPDDPSRLSAFSAR